MKPSTTPCRAPRRTPASRQAGLTLVELMVALVLGMLIAAAAVAALIVARQGFNSVDENSQLRENARFAASLIQRIASLSGFENAAEGFISTDKSPLELRGWDNALLDTSTLPATQVNDSRDTDCTVADTSCDNGSDILRVAYMGVSRPAGTTTPDGSIINCAGLPEAERGTPAYSVFHVVRGAGGEPVLACSYQEPGLGGVWRTQPIAQGVEGFQVLYGVDTLDAGGVAGEDSVADLYLRAADVAAAGQWSRVRSLRIGMVLRGPTGSAPDKAGSAESIPVLGPGFSDADDVGSDLTVAADARMRHRLVFTVHLRNAQFAP
jgi:type IV pilus assembly protein PilW